MLFWKYFEHFSIELVLFLVSITDVVFDSFVPLKKVTILFTLSASITDVTAILRIWIEYWTSWSNPKKETNFYEKNTNLVLSTTTFSYLNELKIGKCKYKEKEITKKVLYPSYDVLVIKISVM